MRRRSVRDYARRALTLDALARLLHYGAGITDVDPARGYRAAPSAGALYPIEVYAAVFKVADLVPGLYHYTPRQHALELVREGDLRAALFRAALSQEPVEGAALVLALTGLPGRLAWKYAGRSERYLLLEAGHIGQNVYLEATALGIGCCALGAFNDDGVNRLLDVDGRQESAVYLLAIGPQLT